MRPQPIEIIEIMALAHRALDRLKAVQGKTLTAFDGKKSPEAGDLMRELNLASDELRLAGDLVRYESWVSRGLAESLWTEQEDDDAGDDGGLP